MLTSIKTQIRKHFFIASGIGLLLGFVFLMLDKQTMRESMTVLLFISYYTLFWALPIGVFILLIVRQFKFKAPLILKVIMKGLIMIPCYLGLITIVSTAVLAISKAIAG